MTVQREPRKFDMTVDDFQFTPEGEVPKPRRPKDWEAFSERMGEAIKEATDAGPSHPQYGMALWFLSLGPHLVQPNSGATP